MSNETDARRGQRAADVLNNEVYAEAWTLIEQEIIHQWREARIPGDREELHQLLRMHAKAKAVIESVMRTGELAKAEIARKQSKAEQFSGVTFAPR